MTARELPVSEWHRLAGTELATVAPLMRQDTSRVLVIEDEGRIVGCWALFPVWHVEGIWIDERYRCRGSVARRLLSGMRRWIRESGLSAVVTSALSPDIEALLVRLNAYALPGSAYVWPMKGSERCQQQ